MKLTPLSIKDKKYFNKFLKMGEHELSVYAFENIYIWKGLFKIYWIEIKNSLCVFFEDSIGCFLYIPPLAEHQNPAVIDEAFKIMDKRNCNKAVSRVENVEEKDISFFRDLGYALSLKSCDYICKRDSLVLLKGDSFKAKRSSVNYFIKHYKFDYLSFSLKYRKNCLLLYEQWMEQRKSKNKDALYQHMIIDNYAALETLFKAYKYLDCVGRIVKIDKKIEAFTIGFRLTNDMFCVLYEITDLSTKGLAQFIFREFCSELPYNYINIMDDSGLENLKKVKLSYRPEKIIPAYIVQK